MADAVPHWAPFTAVDDWAWFRAETSKLLDHVGLDHRWRDGFVEVVLDAWPQKLGVVTIARELHEKVPRDRWPAFLAEQVRSQVEALREREALPPWEQAQRWLRVRLRRREDLPQSHLFLAEEFGDELAVVMVLDDGRRTRTIKPEDVERWGAGVGDVVRIASEHTLAEPVDATQYTHKSGALGVVLAAPKNVYGATHAVWPQTRVPVGERGALVAVPNRHVCFLHALTGEHVPDVLGWIEPWIAARHQNTGPLSPHVHWWRPGRIVRLPHPEFDAQGWT